MSAKTWQQCLEQLRLQMTEATYNQWLKATTGELNNGTLTVCVPNDYAKDWVEHRLRETIERTVNSVFEHSVTVDIVVGKAAIATPQLELEGVREDEYANIVKPDRVFVGTQYFRQVWLPVLGGNLWLLILELRQRCYKSRNTGEIRDTCKVSYAELAASVGINERTARRLLKSEKADLFIIRKETVRRFSSKQGKEVNETTLWQVRLDEPILSDELLEKLDKSSTGQNAR